MSKYDPLTDYLRAYPSSEWRCGFDDIESVLGFSLPPAARSHRSWWSNNPNNNVMTKAWLSAGFLAEQVDMEGERLSFRRAMERASKVEENPHRRGVGDVAKAAILAGKTNEETLLDVKARHPNAQTNGNCINWYRNDLRREGYDVPTNGELKKKQAASSRVQADAGPEPDDLALVQSVLEALRGEPEQAQRLRNAIYAALPKPSPKTAFDVFGSDLPDEAFEGVFPVSRQSKWREVDL